MLDMIAAGTSLIPLLELFFDSKAQDSKIVLQE
jgi:hypothetical protein